MPFYAPGKRKGNRFWLWRGRIAGREYEISTGSLDKETARGVIVDFEKRVRDSRAAEIEAPATFAQAAARYRLANPRLSKADDRFLAKIESDLGARAIATLMPADIVQAGWRLYPGCSPATVNRQAIVPAGAVLHHAGRQGWCPYRPLARLKEDDPRTRTVAREVPLRLIGACTDPVRRAFLVCLFVQGWRVSEPLRLTWDIVDLERAQCERWIAKSRKWRRQALAEETVIALANLPLPASGKREGRLFPWRERWDVYRWLRPLCAAAGVRFTPHMARHSAATWARENGADLKEIMRAFGWSDLKSVLRYADVTVDDQRATLARSAAALAGKTAGKTR